MKRISLGLFVILTENTEYFQYGEYRKEKNRNDIWHTLVWGRVTIRKTETRIHS